MACSRVNFTFFTVHEAQIVGGGFSQEKKPVVQKVDLQSSLMV
jgi:hypothetical protein